MEIIGQEKLEAKIKTVAKGHSFNLQECIDDVIDSRHEHREGVNYIDLVLHFNKREVIKVPVTYSIDENEEETFELC